MIIRERALRWVHRNFGKNVDSYLSEWTINNLLNAFSAGYRVGLKQGRKEK